MQAISCLIYKFFALVIYLDFDTSMSANDFYTKLATVGADLSLIAFASDHFEKYFTGRNFRGEKLSRGKKTRNFWDLLSRMAHQNSFRVKQIFAFIEKVVIRVELT